MIYLRSYGSSDKELAQRKTSLLRDASTLKYQVLKVVCDDSPPKKNRKALKNLLRQMKQLQIKTVFIERISQISHNGRTIYWFLKKLQNSGASIDCLQQNITYEMYLCKIGQKLQAREERKKLTNII